MAIFGSSRDVNTFVSFSRELLDDIVTQQVGYYKIMLRHTDVNVYGESMKKTFIGPVLLNCLIERGDFDVVRSDIGLDSVRKNNFRFLRQQLQEANVLPEVGDIIMYNELYYEVDNVNENQFIMGKNPDYSYSPGLENFGTSYSMICVTHLTSPDSLFIEKHIL